MAEFRHGAQRVVGGSDPCTGCGRRLRLRLRFRREPTRLGGGARGPLGLPAPPAVRPRPAWCPTGTTQDTARAPGMHGLTPSTRPGPLPIDAPRRSPGAPGRGLSGCHTGRAAVRAAAARTAAIACCAGPLGGVLCGCPRVRDGSAAGPIVRTPSAAARVGRGAACPERPAWPLPRTGVPGGSAHGASPGAPSAAPRAVGCQSSGDRAGAVRGGAGRPRCPLPRSVPHGRCLALACRGVRRMARALPRRWTRRARRVRRLVSSATSRQAMMRTPCGTPLTRGRRGLTRSVVSEGNSLSHSISIPSPRS